MKNISTGNCVLTALNLVRQRYGVIDRPFTEFDFYRICKGEGIEVIHSDRKFTFILTIETGEKAITLPKRLRGRNRLSAMFHELGHHFCGHEGLPPEQAFASGLDDDPEELEANLFAEWAIRSTAPIIPIKRSAERTLTILEVKSPNLNEKDLDWPTETRRAA